MMSEGAILVSTRQRGNPLLRYVKNVRWQFAENLVPDYQLGPTTVALFLSLKYHLLHKVPWLGSHRSRLLSGVKKREDGADNQADSRALTVLHIASSRWMIVVMNWRGELRSQAAFT